MCSIWLEKCVKIVWKLCVKSVASGEKNSYFGWDEFRSMVITGPSNVNYKDHSDKVDGKVSGKELQMGGGGERIEKCWGHRSVNCCWRFNHRTRNWIYQNHLWSLQGKGICIKQFNSIAVWITHLIRWVFGEWVVSSTDTQTLDTSSEMLLFTQVITVVSDSVNYFMSALTFIPSTSYPLVQIWAAGQVMRDLKEPIHQSVVIHVMIFSPVHFQKNRPNITTVTNWISQSPALIDLPNCAKWTEGNNEFAPFY